MPKYFKGTLCQGLFSIKCIFFNDLYNSEISVNYITIRSSAAEYLTFITAHNELEQDSVIRNFRITASDGKQYDTGHYNLKAVIAVGYKVNSEDNKIEQKGEYE